MLLCVHQFLWLTIIATAQAEKEDSIQDYLFSFVLIHDILIHAKFPDI